MFVVYESNTGFTERYAKMFAEKANLECWSLYMARIKVPKHSDIIYFGNVESGEVAKLKKARKRYNILAVCPVGLSMGTDAVKEALREKNKLTENSPAMFYLQGGYDGEKNVGLGATFINLIVKDLESKEELDAVEVQMLNDLKNGADYVKEENLAPLLRWYEEC